MHDIIIKKYVTYDKEINMNLYEIKKIYEYVCRTMNEPNVMITIPSANMLAIETALGCAIEKIDFYEEVLEVRKNLENR